MKKLLMLTIAILGTTEMVNAQAAPASTTSKEVKATKHAKKKAERKADKKQSQ